MPIHLPPINRRRFLAGTLAAGAGVLLPRFGQAEEPAGDPNHFVLLADTHVGSRRDQAHRGVRPAKTLEQAVAEIRGLGSRPAGAIVAGDCAFLQGEAGDYTMLGELLKPLRQAGLPVHLALGNHDQRERLLAAFPEAKSQAVAAGTARTSAFPCWKRRTPTGSCWIRSTRPTFPWGCWASRNWRGWPRRWTPGRTSPPWSWPTTIPTGC